MVSEKINLEAHSNEVYDKIGKIQSQIVPTASIEIGATASKAYNVGDLLVKDGSLYKVTKAIAKNDALTAGTNIAITTVGGELKSIGSELNSIAKSTTHVGQIILSTTLNTADKVNKFYGGTWQAFGAGRVLIGAGSNGGYSFSAGSTGGEYVHTLTINEMPSHMHSSRMHNTNGAGVNYLNVQKADAGMGLTVGNEGTSAAGGGGSHNNMQPYVVVYMWRRVS